MALAHGARMALASGRQAILRPIHGRPNIVVLIHNGTTVGLKLPWAVEALTAYRYVLCLLGKPARLPAAVNSPARSAECRPAHHSFSA
jgi:hypothetical protein